MSGVVRPASRATYRLPIRLPMAKIQLNLKMPPALVARLREEAAAEGITVTALAERRLSGDYLVATDPVDEQVADRIAALESRVLALEAGRSPRPPAAPTPVAEAPHADGMADPTPVGERLGTTQLAKLLGIGRSALLNYASKNPDGSMFRGDWRLVGRVALPMGGPRRIIWERVEPGA